MAAHVEPSTSLGLLERPSCAGVQGSSILNPERERLISASVTGRSGISKWGSC